MSNNLISDLISALIATQGGSEVAEFGFVSEATKPSGNKFIFVSRELVGNACWYTLADDSKPVAAPTTSLRGTLKSIYQIDTVRGNKGQYKATKMRLEIATPSSTYVIENGADTVMSQSIASAILFGNVQLGDTITIRVEPADQNEKVVFASVLTERGEKIFPPREFQRQGSVLAAQMHLGCVAPEKKEYDTPYSSGLPPVPVVKLAPTTAEPDVNYEDIPF